MKKLVSLIMVFLLMFSVAAAEGTLVPNEDKTNIPLKDAYEENPVVEGESPITGLEIKEPYTPIMIVLDNAEDAYPHWGVCDASMMIQIPNDGSGSSKILALFADEYPERAGGVRSARMTMIPVAYSFDAAFASGGMANVKGNMVNVREHLGVWGFTKNAKFYDLLGKRYKDREKFVKEPHNLTCMVKEIHNHLIEVNAEFKKRPYLFTDEPLTRGDDAKHIVVKQYVNKKEGKVNHASYAEYDFEEGIGYTRTSATGKNIDRFAETELTFQNLIILRVSLRFQDSYQYIAGHMTGSGCADIFQDGKYIRGAWVRNGYDGRIIIVDEEGNELPLQRGRTFMVITDKNTDVIYE